MILNQILWWIMRVSLAALRFFLEEHVQCSGAGARAACGGLRRWAVTPATCAQWRLHASPAPRNPLLPGILHASPAPRNPLLPGIARAGARMPRRFSREEE